MVQPTNQTRDVPKWAVKPPYPIKQGQLKFAKILHLRNSQILTAAS